MSIHPAESLTRQTPSGPPRFDAHAMTALVRYDLAATTPRVAAERELLNHAFGSDAPAIRQWISDNPCHGMARENVNGWNALMWAAQNAECVELLLPFCDPLQRTDSGETPLSYAAEMHASGSVQLLLGASDAMNRDHKGQTPLMMAAGSRSRNDDEAGLECVKLLAPFSDIDAVDNSGRTALILAVQRRAEPLSPFALVALLAPLSNGAIQNADGDTALDIAIQSQNWPLADCLAAHATPAMRAATVQAHAAERFPRSHVIWEEEVLRAEVAQAAQSRAISEGGSPPPTKSRAATRL